VCTSVNFLTERFEWRGRKDGLNGKTEELADAKSQFKARVIFAALQVAHSLIIDAKGVGESQAGQAAFST
jgi:hypothetical protein